MIAKKILVGLYAVTILGALAIMLISYSESRAAQQCAGLVSGSEGI